MVVSVVLLVGLGIVIALFVITTRTGRYEVWKSMCVWLGRYYFLGTSSTTSSPVTTGTTAGAATTVAWQEQQHRLSRQLWEQWLPRLQPVWPQRQQQLAVSETNFRRKIKRQAVFYWYLSILSFLLNLNEIIANRDKISCSFLD